ncbi:MFS transporter [Pectinatus frisingensis]|uniref:MFS transporter n=1 Tax=Pectinatus frisingensis TaxID=865 RepID=UPI0018C7C34A|nr:MFS transporter [Pectinatus frisingensis]
MNKTEKLWTTNFTALTITNGLLFAGFHGLLPTLPIYVLQQGGTNVQIGLLAGIFTFSAIIIRFFTNTGITKFGKKNFLLLGIFICLISALCYNFIGEVNHILYIRVLHGIGFGIATTLYATIIADIVPASRRGEGIGYFGLGTTFMMAFTPATGIWIIDNFSFSALFIVAAVCQSFALIWTFFCKFKSSTLSTDVKQQVKNSLLDRIVETRALFQAFLTLLFGACVGGLLSFVALLAREVHIQNAGYFFLVCTACVFLSRLFTGKIFDAKGHAWVIMPGAILLTLGSLLLSQTTTITLLLSSAILYGFGIGATMPALQTWIINIVPADRRSIASATFYNFMDIGVGGGSIILGILAGKTGYASVYFYSAAIMVIFMISYGCYILQHKSSISTANALQTDQDN